MIVWITARARASRLNAWTAAVVINDLEFRYGEVGNES